MNPGRFPAFCLFCGLLFAYIPGLKGKSNICYWQQAIQYKMEVTLDVNTNKYSGKQSIKYKNNSPDVLDKVYFHLYMNTFQPGSVMDIKSRTVPDPDPRIGERINHLSPDEIGYEQIRKLTQDGVNLSYEVAGTILEVTLAKPIKPGHSARFEMEYNGQVPLQIRRNGRDNKEGIRYSMAQWYPKMCEYDRNGWNANPYIAREFYGVWGDFDVKITLDSRYVVAASGILQNAKDIGYNYAPEPKSKSNQLTWHFKADNVHDFVWAADPGYTHDVHTCKDGLVLNTFYKPLPDYVDSWKALPGIMEEALKYMNANFGQYPYPTYSYIQGGDGGMEYPMATLITGHRSLNSLVGVSVHEMMHSWYQMVLGFNESLYYWMDEGFTSYATTRVMEYLKTKGLVPGELEEFPFDESNDGYKNLVLQHIEEPLSTHADHFEYNSAYNVGAYTKGQVFLNQLEYVIGKPSFDKGLLDFFNTWKFKHPDVHDFISVMEKASGLELDWYKEYMVYSIKTIDYAIDTVYSDNDQTSILLGRIGMMPMPVDLTVDLKDGSSVTYTIPLDIMRGAKKENTNGKAQVEVLSDWDWVNPYHIIEVPFPIENIESLTIDKSMRMADMNRENNEWPVHKE
ncbi:MAG: M1 family metallopeptidase [Saprospiraceae bacterium]|uniref:M1 family metallopeptidase n=1 Tax=Candidatus Opimibacter skivensis TaxID=2982028 RepID=A0A9D7SSQ0_9BACT|nr:M1 family metallopeptidase [Candidatus Opimibacter skivensis]